MEALTPILARASVLRRSAAGPTCELIAGCAHERALRRRRVSCSGKASAADAFYLIRAGHGGAGDARAGARRRSRIETLGDGDVARLVLAVPALSLALRRPRASAVTARRARRRLPARASARTIRRSATS